MGYEFGTGYDTTPSGLPITAGQGGLPANIKLPGEKQPTIGTVASEPKNKTSIPVPTGTPLPASTETPLSPAPIASFSYNVKSNKIVEFTDASQNAVSYLWDFGDGTISTQKNPIKIYDAYQSYTVKLTVKNSAGTPASYSTVVNVVNMTPDANFTYVIGGLTVYCKNSSNIYASSFLWDFGDGSQSSERNPQHAYAKNGSYSIKLTVNGTYTKQVNITVDVELSLSCTAVTGATGYKWYRSTDGITWTMITNTANPTVGITQAIHGVDSTVQNYFKVTAYNGAGESGYTGVVGVQC